VSDKFEKKTNGQQYTVSKKWDGNMVVTGFTACRLHEISWM